jgi:hypothetical protein
MRVNPIPDAKTVLKALPAWFADSNAVYPHRVQRYRSPKEYREATLRSTSTTQNESAFCGERSNGFEP